MEDAALDDALQQQVTASTFTAIEASLALLSLVRSLEAWSPKLVRKLTADLPNPQAKSKKPQAKSKKPQGKARIGRISLRAHESVLLRKLLDTSAVVTPGSWLHVMAAFNFVLQRQDGSGDANQQVSAVPEAV